MTNKRILLAGETWISKATHIKGFDEFSSTTFHNGAEFFLEVANKHNFIVEQIAAHDVPNKFPQTMSELNEYSAIIVSDIGANSFLLPNSTWLTSHRNPNRLELLNQWVKDGGSLMMAGGYLSFQGFQAIANFKNSPLESVLPVEITQADDRVELPQGVKPHCLDKLFLSDSSIPNMEFLLGYNKTILRSNSKLHMQINGDPLLVTRQVGKGKSLVWTSDIGPHWCPPEFIKWSGFEEIMKNILSWLIEETK